MSSMFRQIPANFGSALLIVLLVCTLATACPTCKDGLAESDAATQKMAEGYFYSILFMMSMPFMILGTFGSAAYFSIRKAQLHQPTTDPTETQSAIG